MGLRDTIDKSVRSSNRNIAIGSLVAIAIGMIGFFGVPLIKVPLKYQHMIGTSKPLMRYLGQTQVLTSHQVSLLTPDQLPLYNVQVVADEVYNLDGKSYEYTDRSNGGESINYYYAVLAFEGGDVLLRSRAIANEEQRAYNGILRPPVEDIAIEMHGKFAAEYVDSDYTLYPFILDQNYTVIEWEAIAFVELLLILCGAIGLGVVVWRRDSTQHPIMKNLARHGEVESIISEIDGEMADKQPWGVYDFGFTRNWVIYKSGNKMDFLRLEDVMWFYHSSSSSRSGTNYYLHVLDRSGHKLKADCGRGTDCINAMMKALAKRAPWSITGNNSDIAKSWKKDREGFARMVDVRRIQIEMPDPKADL